MAPKEIYEQLIKGLQKYFKESELSRAVIGVSGGIDSTLTLKLGVDALGADKVTAISLPEQGVTSPENIQHAQKLAQALGVEFYQQSINSFLPSFLYLPWKSSQLGYQNTKARIRSVLLYNYANTHHALVLGTSNKSEILLGYGTKYGDLAADIEVIGELYKEDVYALAEYLQLPKEIIEKAPSAELYPGQTDASDLGADYSQLDPILKSLDQGFDKLLEKGMNPSLLHNIFKRVKINKHKAEAPPILKLKKPKATKA